MIYLVKLDGWLPLELQKEVLSEITDFKGAIIVKPSVDEVNRLWKERFHINTAVIMNVHSLVTEKFDLFRKLVDFFATKANKTLVLTYYYDLLPYEIKKEFGEREFYEQYPGHNVFIKTLSNTLEKKYFKETITSLARRHLLKKKQTIKLLHLISLSHQVGIDRDKAHEFCEEFIIV